MSFRENILNYVKKEYGTDPEHLWPEYPDYEVLRHRDTKGQKAKWYALIMRVKNESLGIKNAGETEVIYIKGQPETINLLCSGKGFYPAYHMNKKYWISVAIDGTVPMENIKQLLDESYALTENKKRVRT